MSANNRVKELRNELTAERTKLASTEKHIQEKMALHAAEFEALQARMRHAHEQHMIETSKMQARIQQLEKSSDAAVVQKLKQVRIVSVWNIAPDWIGMHWVSCSPNVILADDPWIVMVCFILLHWNVGHKTVLLGYSTVGAYLYFGLNV